VLNATAAIAVGIGLDIEVEAIRRGLDQFRGVDRRFQLKGRARGVSVIDDYGHHPTEIKATLAAARQCGFAKVHVIFQPHRYTRTRDLMEEFASAFADADSLTVLDIYAASEKSIEGISGEALANRIREQSGKPVRYANSFAEAVNAAAAAQEGDMVLTLGAGSVSQLGPMILEKLQAERAQ
jgi:UDP-N-acetylmuramate--alanine ligase